MLVEESTRAAPLGHHEWRDRPGQAVSGANLAVDGRIGARSSIPAGRHLTSDSGRVARWFGEDSSIVVARLCYDCDNRLGHWKLFLHVYCVQSANVNCSEH